MFNSISGEASAAEIVPSETQKSDENETSWTTLLGQLKNGWGPSICSLKWLQVSYKFCFRQSLTGFES